MEVVTNGRKLSWELARWRQGQGRESLLPYEYMRPGQETPIRKVGYAVAIPGFDMYLGTGAYLDDLDAKMTPIIWVLGLAILGIAVIFGGIAWMIGRSISKPLACSAPACRRWPTASSTAKSPVSAAATRSARWPRPFRSSRTTRCGSAGWKRPKPRPRPAPLPNAARRWRTSPAISSAASTASSARYRPPPPACSRRRSR